MDKDNLIPEAGVPPEHLFTFKEGTPGDIDLLPSTLQMPPSENTFVDDRIEIGELYFNYDNLRRGLNEGTTRLRLMTSVEGSLVGFAAFSPEAGKIDLLWVSKDGRGKGIGLKLLNDVVAQMPGRVISMDIWGGKPMQALAKKAGFNYSPGGGMANRYVKNPL